MNVKRTLILLSFLFSMSNLGHAFDLDATVDDDIRKNYNPTKLIEDTGINETVIKKSIEAEPPLVLDEKLPALPNITNQGIGLKQSELKKYAKIEPDVTTTPYRGGDIKIKKGTRIDVINTTTISDWQRVGAQVRFKTNKPISKKRFSLPTGTVFVGEIVETHQPQYTGNGGLVVIRIRSMIYKNQTVPLNAYITKANDNLIFFNNIKGERAYWKTVWEKGNWGRALFSDMMTITADLGKEGNSLILAPFPFAYGTICVGLSAITSPICALFTKGGHVKIPTGNNFRIKLTDDVMIN